MRILGSTAVGSPMGLVVAGDPVMNDVRPFAYVPPVGFDAFGRGGVSAPGGERGSLP
jgi:hypothetical protein